MNPVSIGTVAKKLGMSVVEVDAMVRRGQLKFQYHPHKKSGRGRLRMFDLDDLFPQVQSNNNSTPLQIILSVILGMFLGAIFISFVNFLLQILK